MKKMLKRAAIPCGIYWAILGMQYFLLSILTESWMILGILLIITTRLTLWASPFILSTIVWIAGSWHPKCQIKHIGLTNVVVLAVNCLSFVGCYLLTGGWY